ncbi:ABC transporter permease [Haloechinothrix sp. YIM 98757]|uniref:Transport permease protein n=1 Tax=Haloechinothrix aidingensis TaxID=2752311 RepID=A0A837ZXV9_9PSEU|nr:ABC transporter permease [Haloechinothrix aidingensis]MBA0125476.1 ABC transporter permease [Haloechinothrix aidingensis]
MLRDTWLIFRRDLVLSVRNPTWLFIQLMQPVLYLVLFGPLLATVAEHTPGFPPGDGWTVFTPALLVMLTLFGTAFVGFSLLADYRSGVVERLRVTPASRLALLLGKVGVVAMQATVQAILLLTLAAVAFGVRAPLSGIVLALVIGALLATTIASSSYALALRVRSEDAFPALLNAILLPLLLLSGILLPITTGLAPEWLYTLSRINPFRYVVDAQRAAFRGDFAADALLTGSIVLVLLAGLAITWGAHTFRRESA